MKCVDLYKYNALCSRSLRRKNDETHYQYKNNLPLFEAVVAEKLKIHSEKSNEGRNLEQLFLAKGILENQHLLQEKFKYYNQLTEKEAEKRLKSY